MAKSRTTKQRRSARTKPVKPQRGEEAVRFTPAQKVTPKPPQMMAGAVFYPRAE
jgi:hypothetical protein